MDGKCKNILSCRMVTTNQVIDDESLKGQYMKKYCNADKEIWMDCKRFTVKETLQFCPDFVLPDSPWTLDEIINKFENDL